GSIVLVGAGEGGSDLTVSFDETNIQEVARLTRDAETQSEIVINLGQQVAVSQVVINVTGSRGNKNLTEIAQVEFLNNVYEEIPAPKMNVPVINYYMSATSVGNENLVIGWEHEANVQGYEVKVELLNTDGTVTETSTYTTTANKLKLTGIKPYSIYRFSIQSTSGDWSSGYKDEQESYDATVTGSTNLTNHTNDKDGLPDNTDANYQPSGWNPETGQLDQTNALFGADSIVELQVIPETAPEGPEGITITSEYQALKVSWKSHAKAQDYDLYYREVGGDGAWIKANDPNGDYVDTDVTNDIPDGVANLSPEEKTDQDELIRGTSYTITGLEENTMYEIKMTATNHLGTGEFSQTYLATAKGIVIPSITEYKLINRPGSGTITSVHYNNWNTTEHPNGIENEFAVVDGDYKTYWTSSTWNTGYGTPPLVTFDKEYTIDTIRLTTRLDGVYALGSPYDYVPVRYFDAQQNQMVDVNGTYTVLKDPDNGALYYEIKLPYPVTTNQIQTALRIHPAYNAQYTSISEIMFYEYDSIEDDVDALFTDDLQLELAEGVTQSTIDELTKRVNTIDPISLEYHPKQDQMLTALQRAQDLLNDVQLSDHIKTLDVGIRNLNAGQLIGQSNDYQALGAAVKPGDTITIYIGSDRENTQFDLAITQHNAESGTAVQTYSQKLVVGKNEIVIPESAFAMDCEKGGNLYLRFAANFNDEQTVKVRVSGGTEIPHLNVYGLIDDASKKDEVKEMIRTYIRELKSYVNTLADHYPETADKTHNIYPYDPETSILNSTEIEGQRVTLSLAADQVLSGITDGLATEDEQVDRLYHNLLAWEQLMQVSHLQQGLIDEAIDFDGDGQITQTPLEMLNGKSEQQFYNENKAPKNRINIKYQRMFTGAFMYASSHHIGVGYGSIAGLMNGVPFEFDANGDLTNANEGQLFGWGISHEIGHVHDIKGLTYTEITNNILALITQTFNDETPSRIEGSYDQVYEKVTSRSVGLASSPFVRLAMFWQLHLAYDNDHTYDMLEVNTDANLENDTFYAKLYRATREKGVAPSEAGYDQTAQTFIMRASDAVKKDLREFFEKWGVVASPATNAYLDEQNYPIEDKAIYYLNDEARRLRLQAIENNDLSSLIASESTQVIASFGLDENGNQIANHSYLNQNTVPLQLSVTQDNEKILGYEIIRVESTSQGLEESPVGFVERNHEGNITEYEDVIDVVNNRTFTYKVRAYDYNLNVTEETVLGTIKISHDGTVTKSDWTFETNTQGIDDVADENTGHGSNEFGSINNIKDNSPSTVYNAVKATNNMGQTMKGDPYVTIEMDQIKSIVGLKYTPGTVATQSSFFNFFNLFNRSSEQTCEPISQYEVLVSEDGTNWTKVHSGTFDTTRENTIYFNEAGNSDNSQLWAYNAKYVKLVAKGATSISIAELDILGPQGDNIEIGMDNNDQVYTNGIGKLKSDYEYAPGQVIPAGSLIIMGEYKGDPAYNVPLVLNENNENYAVKAQAILLANLPEDSQLGEVAEGNWIYWITPEQQAEEGNIEGTKVKAELYRYNKLDEQGAPVGQRLVSDTFLYEIDLDNLPTIDLTDSKTRSLTYSYDEIVEIDFEALAEVLENR
ncbi:MAG: M60 family metallopeptidase, partial [Turicibacter sp.]|nr:M60 family metallopeptidase [Turicibacter sp.]